MCRKDFCGYTYAFVRPVPDNGRAMHVARITRRRRLGDVHAATVVPEDEIVPPPFVPVDEFGLRCVLDQLGQKGFALLFRHVEDAYGVARAHIQRLTTRFRVGANDRMAYRRDRRELLGREFGPFRIGIELARTAEQVFACLSVDPGPGFFRQCLVGAVHVVEQRVAAFRRNFEGVEQGTEARRLRIGQVGMPAPARIRQADEIAAIVLLVRYFQDFRVTRQQELVVDMTGKLAEPPTEGDVLIGRQALIAENEDLIFQVRAMYGRERFIVERLREVYADDLGRQRVRKRADLKQRFLHKVVRPEFILRPEPGEIKAATGFRKCLPPVRQAQIDRADRRVFR